MIPLEETKFRHVVLPSFPMPEASAYLKYFWVSGREQSFHAQFRGCVQEPILRFNGINVNFRRWGRDKVGGLDFQVILLDKEASYGLDNPGTQPEAGLLGA